MNCQIVERDETLDGQELWDTMQPGDMVLNAWPYRGKPKGAYFKCPFNGKVWGCIHKIESHNPLTMSPSFVCPDGCHFWVRDGKAIPA